MTILPLLDDAFLSSHWHREYEAFKASPEEAALLQRLRAWSSRQILKETSSEAAFIQRFFVETWGYRIQGEDDSGRYSCRPQFEIANAGQTGGQGSADLALGQFGPDADGVPQVLCEFKDIHSGLDAPYRDDCGDVRLTGTGRACSHPCPPPRFGRRSESYGPTLRECS